MGRRVQTGDNCKDGACPVRLWLIFVLAFLGIMPAHAQSDLPLAGPLLALNTVERDEIALYDVTNDLQRTIRLGTGSHHVWDFSPDGCRVLVTLDDGIRPRRLLSANLRGGAIREHVVYPGDDWAVWAADWSPDGQRIAFSFTRNRFDTEAITHHLTVVTVNDPTPQIYSNTGREHDLAWSPEGAWIAYTSEQERVAGSTPFATAVPTPRPLPGQTLPPATIVSEADLWLISADGTDRYPLTGFDTGHVREPRWSPDGELIGFVYSAGQGNDMLWIISRERGALPTQLTFQFSQVLAYDWLPDATGLLGAMRDFKDAPENQLWRVPVVGNFDENNLRYRPELGLGFVDFPRFDPSGTMLAVRDAYALHLVDLANNRLTRLNAVPLANNPAVWSPVAFTDESRCP